MVGKMKMVKRGKAMCIVIVLCVGSRAAFGHCGVFWRTASLTGRSMSCCHALCVPAHACSVLSPGLGDATLSCPCPSPSSTGTSCSTCRWPNCKVCTDPSLRQLWGRLFKTIGCQRDGCACEMLVLLKQQVSLFEVWAVVLFVVVLVD
jgi:hypothetical protein